MPSTIKLKPGPAPSGGEALSVQSGTILKLMWYDSRVPSMWSMQSTHATATIDTANFLTLPDNAKALMKKGDFIYGLTSTNTESGIYVVDVVDSSTGAIDLKNMNQLGLSDTD